DGDGDLDWFITNITADPTQPPTGFGGWNRLYRNDGNRQFTDVTQAAGVRDSRWSWGTTFFDYDNDGDVDLIATNGYNGTGWIDDRTFLWNNDGGAYADVSDAAGVTDRLQGRGLAHLDYDRDGDLDLFVGGYAVPGMYPMAASSRLLQNNNGTFLDATTSKGPGLAGAGMVTSAVWSDVDADGWLDLIVASEWGAIRLFRNTEGQLHDATQDAGLTELTGWWHGIATADLDNDGDIDFVATNIGLNTRYHPAADRPFEIYLGDFAGLGKQNIVETFRDHDGRRLPLRSKADAERAMPFIGDAFPTQHDYAQATADDIYTPKALADTFHLSANTAASMVFINDGHGHFVNHELPFLAQDAPGYGIVLEDFDLDGNVDIFVAQNSFAPHRETGRFDGGLGLLMHGHGDGRFTPVWPNQSGLVIPEDAKSAVAIDVDDNLSTDILIGVNNGKPIVYRNIAATSQRPVVIRLKGPAGNREAVGARISWTSGSNSRRVAEICSGGGYFSQASRQIALPARESSYDCSVVWPDGKKSEHQIPGASGIHVITAPDDDAVR
ncbi:MAG: VCBS repeat-containing protein, partial [Planctomycetales bacterium]|nr:VCBS repeat-containing protein [Planctomycetales bacterium]